MRANEEANPARYSRVIRFRETDAGGVVYFAELLAFCHEAYEAALAATGLDVRAFFSRDGAAFEERGYAIAVPIVHTQADFFKPMFCGDRITITLSPRQLTPNSFEISYAAFGDVGDESTAPKIAQALTRHVCIKTTERRRCQLPEALVAWIDSLSEHLSEPLGPT